MTDVNGSTKSSGDKIHHEVVLRAREAFLSGISKSYEFRMQQLKNLLRMLEDHEDDFVQALHSDLRKPKQEAVIMEIEFERNDIRHVLMHLKKWVQDEPAEKTLLTLMDTTYIHYEPYGVALVISAWNYPVQLLVAPLIGAIAAGNCAIIKPSEMAPAVAKTFAKLIPMYLDKECFHVVLGGKEETQSLLQERFDYIFYTGSTTVGRIIHQAANKYLTPVTLELGGKSPCFIDDSVDMPVAAKRILWGKWANSGQTCVAPDYMLCTPAIRDKFVEEAKKVVLEWFGKDPRMSPDFARIVNDMHFQRVSRVMQGSGKVAIGGRTVADEKYIEPTVLIDVKETDPIMQDEIFGPILPILTVKNHEEAIEFINKRDKPLTMYIFSNNKRVTKDIIGNTSAGSVCANDALVQLTVETLPFGGVGMSGMGNYHGKYSFDAFSHKKACLIRNYFPPIEKLASSRYFPYSESKLNKSKFLLKKRSFPSIPGLGYIACFLVGAGIALGINYIAKRKIKPNQ